VYTACCKSDTTVKLRPRSTLRPELATIHTIFAPGWLRLRNRCSATVRSATASVTDVHDARPLTLASWGNLSLRRQRQPRVSQQIMAIKQWTKCRA